MSARFGGVPHLLPGTGPSGRCDLIRACPPSGVALPSPVHPTHKLLDKTTNIRDSICAAIASCCELLQRLRQLLRCLALAAQRWPILARWQCVGMGHGARERMFKRGDLWSSYLEQIPHYSTFLPTEAHGSGRFLGLLIRRLHVRVVPGVLRSPRSGRGVPAPVAL